MKFVYYQQYLATASDSGSCGGSCGSGSIVLTATQFGSKYTVSLTTTPTGYWLDAGTAWSVPASISSGGQTCTATGTTSGTVSSGTVIDPTYSSGGNHH